AMYQAIPLRPLLLHLFARAYFAIKSNGRFTLPSPRILISILGKKDLHIVLADDDEDDREVFLEALQEIAPQMKVDICEDGTELMKFLLQDGAAYPDIIFLDLNMPLKSGYQCLKEIR